MKILIACERSGIVRDAFIRRGHDAISCDLEPTKRPGPHYQGDVRNILGDSWDLMIAHPVCRYLTNSGVRWLHSDPDRWNKMRDGAEFFKLFDNAKHIPKRAIENPVMHKYALEIIGRRATQYIQSWWFGDPFKKMTGLWLHGLTPLKATHVISDYDDTPRQAVWLMGPSSDREEKRSETYPCFADAMAKQWG